MDTVKNVYAHDLWFKFACYEVFRLVPELVFSNITYIMKGTYIATEEFF